MVKFRSVFIIIFYVPGLKTGFAGDLTGCKKFTGIIDKYAIIMHGHKVGNLYNGYCCFNRHAEPLRFYGGATTDPGEIKLHS